MNSMVTIFFLWTVCNGLANGSIVTYEELQLLGLSCYPEDTCVEPRTEDYPGISWPYSCSCNRLCSQFDTCCVDSYYNSVKPSTVRPSCRVVNMTHSRTAYFMVDRCSPSDDESAWVRLCNEEWTTEDDLMRLIPVTSLFTFMTYKNYFCFRCYENTDDYSYWRVWLVGKSPQYLQPTPDRTLRYREDEKTLTVTYSDRNVSLPVDLRFDIPPEIWSLPVECVAGVISDCSPDWRDRTVRDKCRTYTGVVLTMKDKAILKYKNAHCALCNFESLEDIGCKTDFNSSYLEEDLDAGVDGGKILTGIDSKTVDEVKKKLFTFTDFVNIMGTDKDKEVDKKKQECRENFIWDPYLKSCRALKCLRPNEVVMRNKCVKI